MRPLEKEFSLVVEAIRYEYENNPLHLKLPALLNMSESATSKANRKGVNILLDITKHIELQKIPQKNIANVINWLEIVDKVIKNQSSRTYYHNEKPRTIPVSVQNDPLRFVVKIHDSFNNWYAAYKFKVNRKLEDMPVKLLEHIYKWVEKINTKFEFCPHPEIVLIEKNFKGDGLDFLYNEGIIKSYGLGYKGSDDEQEINIILNVEKFIDFKAKLESVYLRGAEKSVGKQNFQNIVGVYPNAKWQDITIKFKNGHDVDITIKDKTTRSDYRKVGFEDKRTRKPNKQWGLLIELSKNKGELSWQSYPADKNINARKNEEFFGVSSQEEGGGKINKGFSYIKAPDEKRKTKQLLAKGLKTYFNINEDPFFSYQKEGSYKIKINLIPE